MYTGIYIYICSTDFSELYTALLNAPSETTNPVLLMKVCIYSVCVCGSGVSMHVYIYSVCVSMHIYIVCVCVSG